MKLKGTVLVITSLILTGCSILSGTTKKRSSSYFSSSSGEDSTSNPTAIISTDPTTYAPSTGSDPYTSSSSSSTSLPDFDITAIPVNFTAINDFHGQLDEEPSNNANYYRAGIAKLSSYLKYRKAQGDVLISSGDMYQGSYLCNVDKGQFVSYTFKSIGFDAYTIGNHEFDWGVGPILNNQLALEKDFLGANIYQYPKTGGEWVKSDLGKEYEIKTLYEGTPFEVKVGIIGVIGRDQITSITSTYVSEYIFLDPTSIVKDISTKLRNELGCDIVVASYHTDDASEEIANIDPSNGHHYVDAVFEAHTHQFEEDVVNGVPYLQAGAYSQGISEVKLTFNKNTGEVELLSSGNEFTKSLSLEADPVVETALNSLKDEHYSEFNTIIGSNQTGSAISTDDMSKFYAKLSYDKALIEQPSYDIVGCMFNYSRRSLKSGDFTYSELFETHPFLNEIYIFSVSEYDIWNEKKYTDGYLNPSYDDTKKSNDTFHDVLVYNYNGFHIGVNSNYEKYYNYFPSAFTAQAEHTPVKLSFNCFEIAVEWLETNHNITTANISGSGFYGG